jgi:hypothetical protein
MNGYKWKMWDNTQRKMLVSDVWQKGYKKEYLAETDKGMLNLSASQVGILLETVMRNGEADLNGRTFQVKSNGKSGMDIRYFFNAVQDAEPKPEPKQETIDEIDEINLEDIPF